MSTTGDSEINVRRMTRNDIDTVLVLDRKIGRGQSTISYRDLVVTDPSGPLDFSFVCEYVGIVVGFVLARLEYLGIPLIGTCVIDGIAVDPDYQKHGIGSKLVSKVMDRCYAEGVPTARALIDEGNTALSQFFERLSFKPSKIINYDAIFEYLPSESGTRQW
jgi:ribosomal protein S18 acetylase RimI-like enzyme